MREKDLNDMFGNTEYYQFSDDEELGTIMGYFGQDAEGEVCEMRAVSSMQMDMQACKIFEVKVQEGEGFTEENADAKFICYAVFYQGDTDYS